MSLDKDPGFMSLDIVPDLMDCIVPLERVEDSSFAGTAFFLECFRCETDPEQFIPVLVTNRHVIKDEALRYRVNITDGSVKSHVIGDTIDGFTSNWIVHPNDDIDLAVTIPPYIIGQLATGFNQSWITDIDLLTEGRELFFVGFPLGRGVEAGIPHKSIYRSGCLAQKGEIKFLMEANVFPGSSGSPVFLKPRIKYNVEGEIEFENQSLIGVVSSYIPYLDYAKSTQTGRVRIMFEDNSGLSNVFKIQLLDDIFRTDSFLEQAQSLIAHIESVLGITMRILSIRSP